jgi:Tol biopolymer transport system component
VFPLGSGRPLTEEGAKVEAFTLSPDGRRVAYDLSRPGIGRSEVWITNIEDGTSELVATGDAGDPVWSPDGKAIAYVYFRVSKQPVTGRTAIKQLGGTEQFISAWSTHIFMDFDWSPHRGLVGSYWHSQSEVASLVVWPSNNPDADKPDKVVISSPKTGFWQAQVSPDGRWVSFVAIRADRPGVLEMGVAPADRSSAEHWTRIAADHTWPDKPRWAPDGRTLYFLSRRPAPYFNLWAIRFDPERGTPIGDAFPLTQFNSQDFVISPEVVQSDMDVSSRQVVLVSKKVSGGIWLLDHVDK